MSEDAERAAFEKLTGKFKHYCSDWDGLAIDETCHEFICCSCSFADEAGRDAAVEKLAGTCPRTGFAVGVCKCVGCAPLDDETIKILLGDPEYFE